MSLKLLFISEIIYCLNTANILFRQNWPYISAKFPKYAILLGAFICWTGYLSHLIEFTGRVIRILLTRNSNHTLKPFKKKIKPIYLQ